MVKKSSEHCKKLRSYAGEFQTALRGWFLRERRELPWRSKASVYRTVVSEFMLQQTQVKTVLPYFERWIARWSSFEALAAAESAEVMRAWEGLGYYSRARNLHALAKQIFFEGRIPNTVDDWLRFPGIGNYTAAAITSIAQGIPTAVVDGNVVRILARITADETSFKDSSAGVKHFSDLAEILLDTKFPGDHNEAMMELGATVCTKHNPQCVRCPILSFCAGASKGKVGELPKFIHRPMKKIELQRVLIMQKGALLMIRNCNKSKRLQEILELPRWEDIFPKTLPKASAHLFTGRRAIANESIIEHIFSADDSEIFGKAFPSACIWVNYEDLGNFALSGPHRKWLNKILT